MNTMHLTSGMIGAGDADVMVTLKRITILLRTMCEIYALVCRESFPSATFYFLPADITTQILNFGLPAPIDVQFAGK